MSRRKETRTRSVEMTKSKRPPLTRSQTMARVRGRDTTPELIVRRLLTQLQYRYRLHRTDIPGKPDIAFIGQRKAIYVNGCFWHGHECSRGARAPKANADYWATKIDRNRQRDRTTATQLGQAGWSSLTIWECELRDRNAVRELLSRWLEDKGISFKDS